MPLNLTDFNHFYIINKVCGLEKQRHYLEALRRKEFQIYFQPKISGKSQKIASAEVLIRWKRADGELSFRFWKKQGKSRLWITMFMRRLSSGLQTEEAQD